MKTYLKKIIGGAALGLALLANSAPTWAGLAFLSEVKIGQLIGIRALCMQRGTVSTNCNTSVVTVYKTASDRLYVSCFAQDIYGALRMLFKLQIQN